MNQSPLKSSLLLMISIVQQHSSTAVYNDYNIFDYLFTGPRAFFLSFARSLRSCLVVGDPVPLL